MGRHEWQKALANVEANRLVIDGEDKSRLHVALKKAAIKKVV